MLAALIAVAVGQVSTAVHVVVEVLGRTKKEVSVPGTAMGQLQALGAAKLGATVLEMVLDGTSNGGLLSSSVAVSTFGPVLVLDISLGTGVASDSSTLLLVAGRLDMGRNLKDNGLDLGKDGHAGTKSADNITDVDIAALLERTLIVLEFIRGKCGGHMERLSNRHSGSRAERGDQ